MLTPQSDVLVILHKQELPVTNTYHVIRNDSLVRFTGNEYIELPNVIELAALVQKVAKENKKAEHELSVFVRTVTICDPSASSNLIPQGSLEIGFFGREPDDVFARRRVAHEQAVRQQASNEKKVLQSAINDKQRMIEEHLRSIKNLEQKIQSLAT